jgi:hypothetical protein
MDGKELDGFRTRVNLVPFISKLQIKGIGKLVCEHGVIWLGCSKPLEALNSLKVGAHLFIVKFLHLLVHWMATCFVSCDHRSIAALDCANVVQAFIEMTLTETLTVISEWISTPKDIAAWATH